MFLKNRPINIKLLSKKQLFHIIHSQLNDLPSLLDKILKLFKYSFLLLPSRMFYHRENVIPLPSVTLEKIMKEIFTEKIKSLIF